ncbi:YkgJ family cysteine cluster protein [Sphingomonas immobilis]|nr:YkgJ family cysteine cluster protein [Sphingomonas sp. CA1-15]
MATHPDVHFTCNGCGKCCHDLRLPVGIEEALSWMARGGEVQVLVSAAPWVREPAPDDAVAQYKRERTFLARTAGVPIRVSALLVAAFDGACPFLLPNMLCGGYEERPRVCRIFPAEVNPRALISPANKPCPPEVWTGDNELFARDNVAVSEENQALIASVRQSTIDEVAAKGRLCAVLGIDVAAIESEGYAIYKPSAETLRTALSEEWEVVEPTVWRIVSNRTRSLEVLGSSGVAADAGGGRWSYHGFNPAD